MRRVIVIAVAGASLAGCSSFSWDALKPAPPTVQLQLESIPSGAEARTSIGPSCKTPCAVPVPAPEGGFSVTYTLPKFQPVTVPVQVVRLPGDFSSPGSTSLDPNPVIAELPPAGPPPKAGRKTLQPKKPRAPKGTASAPPPPGSPFPEPVAPPPTR
jgi:hypothetical protein